MDYFDDFRERRIRLTDERRAHLLEAHPEMVDAFPHIAETLARPLLVVQSVSDPEALLYYERITHARLGDRYLCVVVVDREDAFILTAYLADRPKAGVVRWQRE